VTLASRACERREWKDAKAFVVPAAAYAESGDIAEATKAESKALELNPEMDRAAIEARLEIYKAGKP